MGRLLITASTLGWIACGTTAAPPAPTTTAAPRVTAPVAFEFDEREVRIPARDLTLEGTISVPREAGARRPAVVLIHGSGPFGRDESMDGQLGDQFGHDVLVFRDVAHHLARAGFVVIRYDKRTCTPETGCSNSYPNVSDVGFDEITADAQAVITWLGDQPEVDPTRLHLIGHSLGGALLPELITDNPSVRSGVALAAPYRPIDRVSAYQEDYATQLAQRRERHPLLVGIKVRTLREIARGTRRLRQGVLTDSHIAGVPVAFWSAWMDLGDALPALIDELDRPLLVLSGTADTNVPPAETALWKERLAAVQPNPGHRTEVLPCISHALNCIDRDAADGPTAARDVSPEVLSRVVDFLGQPRQ